MAGLLLLAVFVGLLLPVQTGVNAQLRTSLGHPIATALVSFGVGVVGLPVAVLWLRIPVPLAEAWSQSAWWQWLGAGTTIAAVVGGQMVASLMLDHFGWIGFPEHPISGLRLLGAGLVILGVALIQR